MLFINIHDDTSFMSNKNKMILCISSLWILNLLSHSYLNNFNILSEILSIVSIISPLFWYNYKINSLYHKFDRILVISVFIYLILTKYYLYYHIRDFISIVSIIIIFYTISIKSCIQKNYDLQLYSHLLFRYFTFLLVYNYIMQNVNEIKKIKYISLITLEYIIFNIYLFKKIKDKRIGKYILYNILIIIANETLYYQNLI